MLRYYPVSTIVEGQGLNFTVQSYLDVLDLGLVSCRELIPDLADLLDAIIRKIDSFAQRPRIHGINDEDDAWDCLRLGVARIGRSAPCVA
jgi:hypothetical protein